MRRAEELPQQHVRVVRVERRVLRRPVEQVVRLPHQELVQRPVPRDQDRERLLPRAAGPACLLPGARDRSGIADHQAGIQRADIHPQLEGIRRGDPDQLPLEQAPLDLPPLRRRVAGPVGRHPLDQLRRLDGERLLGIAEEQLRDDPRPGEGDVPDAALRQLGEQPGRLGVGAPALAHLPLQERRVPERERLLSSGRAVIVHHPRFPPGELQHQLPRVRDRRRAADEARVRPIVLAEPGQPPQHRGHVGAEEAPVGVDLIDHHELQARQEGAPGGMVRKDADVQHVRVREHHPRGAADRRPLAPRGIAVIRRGPQVRIERRVPELAELILRQRLRGKEIERPRRLPLQHPLDHRHVVAERLAAGRRGDDRDIVPPPHPVDRLRLVRVEPLDARGRQRRPQRLRQRPLQLPIAGRPRRITARLSDKLTLVRRKAAELLEEATRPHSWAPPPALLFVPGAARQCRRARCLRSRG